MARLGKRFEVDRKDPRAPSQEIWDAMSEEERAEVVASLPTDMPLDLHPPEGDSHRIPKEASRDALGEFFKRIGRRIYVSSELVTYYPGEPRFCPDVLAVLDVDPHPRESWMVENEGKGLDFVLEIHSRGDDRKDLEENVERYARLGIPEYFAFHRPQARLLGWRLRPGARSYERLVPQAGRFSSEVLGLELTVEQGRVRFYYGSAPLLFADELIAKLERMVADLTESRDDAVRRTAEEAKRAEEEAKRADDERARREALEVEVEHLRAQLREREKG
jgi:Uma2 family endonuclease